MGTSEVGHMNLGSGDILPGLKSEAS